MQPTLAKLCLHQLETLAEGFKVQQGEWSATSPPTLEVGKQPSILPTPMGDAASHLPEHLMWRAQLFQGPSERGHHNKH